jgi:hypothetical protein
VCIVLANRAACFGHLCDYLPDVVRVAHDHGAHDRSYGNNNRAVQRGDQGLYHRPANRSDTATDTAGPAGTHPHPIRTHDIGDPGDHDRWHRGGVHCGKYLRGDRSVINQPFVDQPVVDQPLVNQPVLNQPVLWRTVIGRTVIGRANRRVGSVQRFSCRV